MGAWVFDEHFFSDLLVKMRSTGIINQFRVKTVDSPFESNKE